MSALRAVKPLSAGARVALIAPAGGLRGVDDVERAKDNAMSLGWEPIVGESVLAHAGYFAGNDTQRLTDLNAALADRSVDGIWCLRGGYGTMRLLPEIDFDSLIAAPRPVIGFSDVTSLLSAIQVRCGLRCYHGPVARAPLTAFTRDSLRKAVTGDSDPCGAASGARTLRGGGAEGVLTGGNLAVLAALTGTPFAPRMDGAILVLEDIDERTYRVDRMLRQLYLAGALEGVRALAFGHCTNCGEHAESGSRALDEVLLEMAELLRIPCIAGIPLGHIDDQWTIPLGAHARLDADACTLNVLS